MSAQTSTGPAPRPPAARRRRPTGGGRHARPGADWLLLAGLLAIVALVAVPRLLNLDSGLPHIVRPDEPTVLRRALAALEGQLTPPAFDWPPASSYLLAAALAAVRAWFPQLLAEPGAEYLVGRVVFVGVALGAVLLTGLLGSRLADGPQRRRATAWGAAAAFGLSYVSVRLSRIPHPEHLQIVFVLGSLLATLAYDRRRRGGWLAAAGVLAGLAAATKYLGGLAVVPAAVAVLWWPGAARAKLGRLAVLAAAAAAGLFAGTLGTILGLRHVLDGLLWQLSHQAGGHLGYDSLSASWWFHLTTSLPGAWGWPLTLLTVAGVAAVAVHGTRAQRLALTFLLPVFLLVGLSRVRFPHYVLLLLPVAAPLAVVALTRLSGMLTGGRRARTAGVVAGVLVAALLPTVLDAARLVRAAGAPDTRLQAMHEVTGLPGPVWAESYSVPATVVDRPVASFGDSPEVVDCGCFAVVSSTMEQRYRREPERYAAQVAVYDAIRDRGSVTRVLAPSVPLSYDWDLLPPWGMRRVPLRGDPPVTGPTITIVDLRG